MRPALRRTQSRVDAEFLIASANLLTDRNDVYSISNISMAERLIEGTCLRILSRVDSPLAIVRVPRMSFLGFRAAICRAAW